MNGGSAWHRLDATRCDARERHMRALCSTHRRTVGGRGTPRSGKKGRFRYVAAGRGGRRAAGRRRDARPRFDHRARPGPARPVARASIAVHVSMLATVDATDFRSVRHRPVSWIDIVRLPPAASSRRDIRQQAGPAERPVRPSRIDPSCVSAESHGCTGCGERGRTRGSRPRSDDYRPCRCG